jgi:hypothetical protein
MRVTTARTLAFDQTCDVFNDDFRTMLPGLTAMRIFCIALSHCPAASRPSAFSLVLISAECSALSTMIASDATRARHDLAARCFAHNAPGSVLSIQRQTSSPSTVRIHVALSFIDLVESTSSDSGNAGLRCQPSSSVVVDADLDAAEPMGAGCTAARNENGISALRRLIIFSIPTSLFERSRHEQRVAGPIQFSRAKSLSGTRGMIPAARHTARHSDKATYRRIEPDIRSGVLFGARKETRKRQSAHLNPEQAACDGYSESLARLNFFLLFLPTKIRTIPALA